MFNRKAKQAVPTEIALVQFALWLFRGSDRSRRLGSEVGRADARDRHVGI
jgi:hypothetical protein